MLNKILISIFIFFSSQNFLFAEETSPEVDLQNIEISSLKKEKTKKDYEKEDDLLNPTVPYKESNDKKEDDLKLDGSVGVNKETKSVDEVKVNIGTKF